VATKAAEAQLAAAVKRARAAIEAELEAVVRRTKLSLEHQGVPAQLVDAAVDEELAHGARLLKALEGVKVVLDSACAFVLNR
jgi:ATP-dependent helicase HepA